MFKQLSEALEDLPQRQGGRAGDGRFPATDVLVTVKCMSTRQPRRHSVPFQSLLLSGVTVPIGQACPVDNGLRGHIVNREDVSRLIVVRPTVSGRRLPSRQRHFRR